MLRRATRHRARPGDPRRQPEACPPDPALAAERLSSVDGELAEIRRQHRELCLLAHALYVAARGGQEAADLVRMLGHFIARAETHFAAEERLLRQLAHGSGRSQEAAHRQIGERLMQARRALRAGGSPTTLAELHGALDDFLIHLIREKDPFGH